MDSIANMWTDYSLYNPEQGGGEQNMFSLGGENYNDLGQIGLGGWANEMGWAGGDQYMQAGDSTTFQNTPEYQQWLDQTLGKDWRVGTLDRGNYFDNRVINSDGQQVFQKNSADDDMGDFASILGVVTPFAAGVSPINIGASFFDNPITQKIFNQALTNAGTAAVTGGNPITSGLSGAVGAAIPGYNLGGQLSIENPALQNLFNRGVTGATQAAIGGGDPLMGAAQAALPSALGTAFQSLSEGNSQLGMSFDASQNTVDGYLSRMQGQSSVPYEPLADMGITAPTMQVEASIPGFNTEPTTVQNQVQSAQQAGISQPVSRPPAWAQALSGVMGMYSGLDNLRRYRGLSKSLSGLFGANSPYAKQLRQRLERMDAARGRRSDYAGRETQLAAALADRQAAMAPSMMNLQSAQNQGLMSLFNNALKLGTNEDVSNWLGGMFKG